jgi:hypothetical protein
MKRYNKRLRTIKKLLLSKSFCFVLLTNKNAGKILRQGYTDKELVEELRRLIRAIEFIRRSDK